jgi:transposase
MVRLEVFGQKGAATDMQLSRFEDCMQNVACWADRVKIVWWDGDGICLFAKTLEKAQFCWCRIAPANETCPVARPCRLDGLEKDSADNGAASAIAARRANIPSAPQRSATKMVSPRSSE